MNQATGDRDQPGPMHSAIRRPGGVLLVSCYELGHIPHGLAMPAAFLERAGFAPRCVDLAVESLPDHAIDQATLVAISVPMHTALRIGARVAQRCRARNPEATIALHGSYAVLNADYLDELGADVLLAGESEQELVAVAETLADGRGLGAPVERRRTTLARLAFPRPGRDGLPDLARYARFDPGEGTGDRLALVGYTETSRGCLDQCHHCPLPAVYDGRFFVVPSDIVLDDIAALRQRGAQHITFGDPDFLNGPGHGLAILRQMHRRWPELTFDITAQITHLKRHRARLDELVALGCGFVVSAVESLSDRVLARLRKRHRQADVIEVLAACRAAGLILRPTFVTFTPWTTLEDVVELVDFIAAEDLIGHVDPVQLSIRLLVPPGSLLLRAEDTRPAFGELDREALTHTWLHPDPRVDALQRELADEVARAAQDPAEETGEGDPAALFATLRRRVHHAAGRLGPVIPVQPPAVPAPRKPVPRLTEPWFC